MKEYSFKNLQNIGYFTPGEGRLGNQLWRIAWTYGQSVLNNGKMTCIPDWKYKAFFSLPEEFYKTPREDSIDGGIDYYQELKYWYFCSEDIWNFFQPSELAKNTLSFYTQNEYKNMKTFGCAIHHRYGDFLYDYNRNRFPILSKKYYIDSINWVLNKEKESIFYIFSDEISKAKELYYSDAFFTDLINNKRIIFLEETPQALKILSQISDPNNLNRHFRDVAKVPDWLDLFSISMCKNHIISNSTFSWWGAFLSENKEVIYPSIWFGTDPSVKEIPWKNMIPDGWKEINAN